MKFALFFGNRGFMPAELIEGARDDMVKAVTNAGYDYIMMRTTLQRRAKIYLLLIKTRTKSAQCVNIQKVHLLSIHSTRTH